MSRLLWGLQRGNGSHGYSSYQAPAKAGGRTPPSEFVCPITQVRGAWAPARPHNCYLLLLIPVKDVVSQCTSGGWCTKCVHGTKLQGMAGQGAGACLCAVGLQKLLNQQHDLRAQAGWWSVYSIGGSQVHHSLPETLARLASSQG